MSHRHLKEELTCPICMELFRQPRRLPCGHSYCHICLKAMLERCPEDSRLYLHYSRSLVCPECREEVNMDYDRGVETIPPDFKLSKLVDLFKFMKKNDSSDSSGDELVTSTKASHELTPCPTGNSVASVTIANEPATNLPAMSSQQVNLPSSPVSQPLAATSAAGLPTQPQITTPSVGSPHTQTVTTSIASSPIHPLHPQSSTAVVTSSPTQISSPQPHISSTLGICPILATATGPQIQPNIEQISSEPSAAALVNSTTSDPATVPSMGLHYNDPPAAMNTRPGDVPYHSQPDITRLTTTSGSSSNMLPSDTTAPSTTRPASKTPNYQFQSSSAINTPTPVLNVPSNAGISFDLNADIDGSRTDGNDHEDLSSELGAVGGLTSSGRSRNGLPGMVEQSGDSLEILSNWVNENHFYSQNCQDISQSSLPVEDAEAQISHGNRQCAMSRDGDRATRAQSVPAEMGEPKKSGKVGRSTENVAAKGAPGVKARRVRSGVFSRFADSDSSSDSSGSDRRVRSQRPAGKPKRWLMTRFLRSVILSESSSTDYSDDDDDAAVGSASRNKATSSHTATGRTDTQSTNASSRPQSVMTDQADSPRQTGLLQVVSIQKPTTDNSEILPYPITHQNSEHHQTPKIKTQDELSAQSSINQNFSREQTIDNASRPHLHSADSTTLPKELTNRNSPNRSIDSTVPKDIRRGNSTTEVTNAGRPISSATHTPRTCNPRLTERHSGQTARNEIYQQVSNLQNVGQPPTFYDNVNVITSDGESNTRCGNVPNVGSPPTFYDNVTVNHGLRQTQFDNESNRRADYTQDSGSLSLRESSSNPCNSPNLEPYSCQNNSTHTSIPHEAQTFYDNMNSGHARPIQTSPSVHHTNTRTTNPVTDIEELKTGYEHVQPEYEGNDSDRHDSSTEIGPGTAMHMGELSDNISWLPASSQDSQHGNEPRILARSHTASSNNPSARKSPASRALPDSRGLPSLYDNVGNWVSIDDPQHSNPVLSNQGNTGNRRNTHEGINPRKGCSAQGRRSQNSDLIPEGQQYSTDAPSPRSEDLQFTDNYFDQYSQHFRRGGAIDHNSVTPREAPREGSVHQRRTGGSGEAAAAKVSSTDCRDVQNSTNSRASLKKYGASPRTEAFEAPTPEACSDTTTTTDSPTTSYSDGLSNSCSPEAGYGASVPQSKKPQSRLKKFFTSLLSLSSSDNEEDKNYHENSSSDSSGW